MTNRKWNWLKNDETQNSRSSSSSSPQRQRTEQTSPVAYFGPMSFGSMSQFFQQMERMVDSTFQNFGKMPFMNTMEEIQKAMLCPQVDITSTDNEYTISVEAPGIEEKNIRIDLSSDRTLVISGEKRMENENHNYHNLERTYGSFQRTLALPEDMDQENISADFKNGVITITAQKRNSSEMQSRRIEINSDNARQGTRNTGRQEARNNESATNTASKKAA